MRSCPARLRRPTMWFIPAWAGNTSSWQLMAWAAAVHPRVGGEHPRAPMSPMRVAGSSPRGRGTHHLQYDDRAPERFIPAWAGNTPPFAEASAWSAVHPRVGGEHRDVGSQAVHDGGSSPRGRGTPPPLPNKLASGPVHPRVGGEHPSIRSRASLTSGSSPRGRGTHPRTLRVGSRHRFIPAWAGNTRPSRPDCRH